MFCISKILNPCFIIVMVSIRMVTNQFEPIQIGTRKPPGTSHTREFCISLSNTIKARHKTCFLRPDTGPCRADIIQWYFDVKQSKCYRFFWGGCQGNGNRFETREKCRSYCIINDTIPEIKVPRYCSQPFDYGNCFGHYYRWSFEAITKTCKRRLYSGCGGNQNNFHTQRDCAFTCIRGPNTSIHKQNHLTTCIPLIMDERL